MQIIPSIDIVNGQCVRLLKGDYGKMKTYSATPEEVARFYMQSGARALHVVDLDGAKEGRIMNWSSLAAVLALPGMEVQVGGGIRTETEVDEVLALGASRVVVGSVAIESPHTIKAWIEKHGPSKFCIALDVKDGALAYHGWLTKSSKSFSTTVSQMSDLGLRHFLSTDIGRDGTLEGPNVNFYSSLVDNYADVHWFASGGIRSIEDVRALKTAGVSGVIIGKALLDGTIHIEELVEAAC